MAASKRKSEKVGSSESDFSLTKRQRVIAKDEHDKQRQIDFLRRKRLREKRRTEQSARDAAAKYKKRYKREMARRQRLGHDGPISE